MVFENYHFVIIKWSKGCFWQINTYFLSQNIHLAPRHTHPNFGLLFGLEIIIFSKNQKMRNIN